MSRSLGHDCIVVAPSLIPKKAGDHVKTNRRDAENLARLLRAGQLTAVWVPDERHEAVRDLSRARAAAVDDLKSKRQQISALLLRLGLHYPGKTTSWIGVGMALATPPSEPCRRFSRTRLSGRWFPHRDRLADCQAACSANSPAFAK